MGIQEIVRRWQAGAGPRQIGSGTGLSRNTVRKYLSAARAEGITRDGPVVAEEQLRWLATISQSGPRRVDTPRKDLLEPWADQIYQWCTGDRLQMTRIHTLKVPGKGAKSPGMTSDAPGIRAKTPGMISKLPGMDPKSTGHGSQIELCPAPCPDVP